MLETVNVNVLAKLGQLRITSLEAARVQKSREYRTLTAALIMAPWDAHPMPPQKRVG